MRPRDIERIANSLVDSFSNPAQASAGCGGISDTLSYYCDAYTCMVTPMYECGGQGKFTCVAGGVTCTVEFSCVTNFECLFGQYTL
jgi:hypothetical protein